MTSLRAAIIAGALAWAAAEPSAGAARFALMLGNNVGQGADVRLHFAESDVIRMASVLTRFGGFAPAATVTLLGQDAPQVRAALADLAQRMRAAPGEHLVLVYYSGHADAQALHLGSSGMPLGELKDLVTALPAAARVLVLDACRAGVLTRAKGGAPGGGFDVALGAPRQPEGVAILASSTDSEMAQESDQLAGSVFTHYFRVGLSGLADRNRDGTVSLVEAFDYVSARTLAATLGTSTGPQHPTFRLDLAGREDLVLTRPGLAGVGYGQVRLDVPGWYFVHRPDGTVAAEALSRGQDAVALEAGDYQITRRERSHLDVAAVTVPEGGTIAISGRGSRRVAFGRMVRKGGGPAAAYGLSAATSLRTPLEELGPSFGAALAGRLDLSAASLELRAGVGRAHQAGDRFESTTWEGSATLALLRFFDAERPRPLDLAWAVGLEAGVSRLTQRLDDGGQRRSWNPLAGPVAVVEAPLGKRFCLRADLGLPFYALRVAQPDGSDRTALRVAFRAALGGGVSF